MIGEASRSDLRPMRIVFVLSQGKRFRHSAGRFDRDCTFRVKGFRLASAQRSCAPWVFLNIPTQVILRHPVRFQTEELRRCCNENSYMGRRLLTVQLYHQISRLLAALRGSELLNSSAFKMDLTLQSSRQSLTSAIRLIYTNIANSRKCFRWA